MSKGTAIFVIEKGIKAIVCFSMWIDLVSDLDALPLDSNAANSRSIQFLLAIEGNGNDSAALVANQIVADLVRHTRENRNIVFHPTKASKQTLRIKCALSSIALVHAGTSLRNVSSH